MTLEYTLTNVDYIRVTSLIEDHIVCDNFRLINFGGTNP
jgi:hypothetical protein